MQAIGITEFREKLSDLIDGVKWTKEPVLLLKNGKPFVAVVCMEDAAKLGIDADSIQEAG